MRKFFAVIILLIVIMTAAFYFLAATPYGLQIVTKTLSCFFQGTLIIKQVEGDNLSHFTIQQLSYQSADMKISLDDIHLSWSPKELLSHKIFIENLEVDHLRVSLPEDKKENKSFYSPLDFLRWIKIIDLQEAALHHIFISKNKKTFINFSLTSEGKWNNAGKTFFVNVNDVQGKIAGRSVEGNLSFSYNKNEMILKNSRLKIGKALAEISGKMGQKCHLSWYITIPDIHEITSIGQGRFFSKGILSGTYKKAEITAIFKAEKMSFDDVKLDMPNAKIRSTILPQSIDSDFIIENVNFSTPDIPPFNFKNIQLQTKYIFSQPVIFSGSFILGQGKGKISGMLRPEKGWPIDLHVEGKNLLITDLPEYKIVASPAVLINHTADGMNIKGDLIINSAVINPNDLREMTTLPEETVILGKARSSDKTPYNLSMQVQVILGEKFLISYADLQTKLQGRLFVSKKFGSPIIGSGILSTVKGRYRAYGRLLHIKKGRLIYTGSPLDNPGLDIQASKTFDVVSFAKDQSQFAADHDTTSIYQGREKITAGLSVKGTFKKPLVSFFSDPKGMTQNDILSYLLFGCPQSQIKNMGSLAILNNISYGIHAEKHLGAPSIGKITKKIKKTLGLNDISMTSVETFDPEDNKLKMNTAVSIGKKFGKYISVQYKVGVFNSLSILNLKYQINKLFAIQSETSSHENGADLLFEYEQD